MCFKFCFHERDVLDMLGLNHNFTNLKTVVNDNFFINYIKYLRSLLLMRLNMYIANKICILTAHEKWQIRN